jgi:transposase
MNAKNRYYRRSRISEKKFRQLLRCFAMDFTATDTATLTGLSVRSVNSIYLKLRSQIATVCEQQSPLQGAVEVDERTLVRTVSGASEAVAPMARRLCLVC